MPVAASRPNNVAYVSGRIEPAGSRAVAAPSSRMINAGWVSVGIDHDALHADDTTVPVLAPGLGKTKTGRLWVVSSLRPTNSMASGMPAVARSPRDRPCQRRGGGRGPSIPSRRSDPDYGQADKAGDTVKRVSLGTVRHSWPDGAADARLCGRGSNRTLQPAVLSRRMACHRGHRMADAVGASCAALDPILRLVEAHVMAAERLHGDDTTVPLQGPGDVLTQLAQSSAAATVARRRGDRSPRARAAGARGRCFAQDACA